jgi:hypothetical protein
VIVIGGYIQRRVLGLPPFEDDGSKQFTAPVENQAPRRRWSRRERLQRLGRDAEPEAAEPDAVLIDDPPNKEPTVQEKSQP